MAPLFVRWRSKSLKWFPKPYGIWPRFLSSLSLDQTHLYSLSPDYIIFLPAPPKSHSPFGFKIFELAVPLTRIVPDGPNILSLPSYLLFILEISAQMPLPQEPSLDQFCASSRSTTPTPHLPGTWSTLPSPGYGVQLESSVLLTCLLRQTFLSYCLVTLSWSKGWYLILGRYSTKIY